MTVDKFETIGKKQKKKPANGAQSGAGGKVGNQHNNRDGGERRGGKFGGERTNGRAYDGQGRDGKPGRNGKFEKQ